VLTDALEMKALAETRLPPWQTAAEALRAGADVLVFEGDPELIEHSLAWLNGQIERDELAPAMISTALARWAAVRARLKHLGHVGANPDPGSLLAPILRDGMAIWPPAAPLPAGFVALDVGRGPELAAALEWPLVSIGADAGSAGRVAVAEDADAAEAFPPPTFTGLDWLIVLGGARIPDNVPASVGLVMAYDLPASLWPAIVPHLAPANSRASVQAGLP
jgi:hypothetical protein